LTVGVAGAVGTDAAGCFPNIDGAVGVGADGDGFPNTEGAGGVAAVAGVGLLKSENGVVVVGGG